MGSGVPGISGVILDFVGLGISTVSVASGISAAISSYSITDIQIKFAYMLFSR